LIILYLQEKKEYMYQSTKIVPISQDSYSDWYPDLVLPLKVNDPQTIANRSSQTSKPSLDNTPYLDRPNRINISNFLVTIDQGENTNMSPAPKMHKRGIITNFSRKSARRMKIKVCGIDWSAYKTRLFFTCTFGQSFPTKTEDLNYYRESILRNIRSHAHADLILWRKEFQKRGAPHFHFLLFYLTKLSDQDMRHFAHLLKDDWGWLTFHLNPLSHTVGSDIRECNSNNKMFFYLSKYLGKINEEKSPTYLGRIWGIDGDVIAASELSFETSYEYLLQLRRVIEKDFCLRFTCPFDFSYYILHFNNVKLLLNLEHLLIYVKLINKSTHDPTGLQLQEALEARLADHA
jgi:hypothetical protein